MATLLTTAEVCEALGVTRITLYRWGVAGTGPESIKLPGGQVRYPADRFAAWLDERAAA